MIGLIKREFNLTARLKKYTVLFFGVIALSLLSLAMTACNKPNNDNTSAGAPVLVQVVDKYNVIEFNKEFYAVPHGTAVDWASKDFAKTPGIITDSNKENLIKKIPVAAPPASAPVGNASAVSSADPVLVQVVGKFNIVAFNKKYYAIPHGIAVDWTSKDFDKTPGMLVNSDKESLIKKLPAGSSK